MVKTLNNTYHRWDGSKKRNTKTPVCRIQALSARSLLHLLQFLQSFPLQLLLLLSSLLANLMIQMPVETPGGGGTPKEWLDKA